MDTELIIITEYCTYNQAEPEFIFGLQEVGLIDLLERDNQFYIYSSQLRELERYTRWHYELSVNVEGIDVIQNLMNRIEEMEKEIVHLKDRVRSNVG